MRPEDCCGWSGKTTPECLDFKIGEEVETPYSGAWTRHRIVERYRVRIGQSKVAYVVDPPVPKTVHGNMDARGKMDAAWFRRVNKPEAANVQA